MPTALRESVLAAAAAALQAAIPTVPVERARRAPVAVEEMPRLVLRGLDAQADETQSPTETFWTFGFSVTGYVKAATDLGAEQAMSDLHAQVMAVMPTAELGVASVQATAGPTEMQLYEADVSSLAAGEFTVIFNALAIAPTGFPFAL